MLVLSRKRGEEIVIGDLIRVVVIDIRGDQCRIGVEAPTQVSVHRSEVLERIKAEQRREADARARAEPEQDGGGAGEWTQLYPPERG